MGALSDYLENKLIDQIFRGQAYAFPATLYVGLVTVAENDAAGGAEVSGNGYARVAVAASLANWAGTQAAGSTTASSGTGGTTTNNAAIDFPTPTGAWGTVVGWGIWDAATGGNLLVYGALTSNQQPNSGNSVSFSAGQLSVQIDN